MSSWKVIGTPGSVVAQFTTHGAVHVCSASKKALPTISSRVSLPLMLDVINEGSCERDIVASVVIVSKET